MCLRHLPASGRLHHKPWLPCPCPKRWPNSCSLLFASLPPPWRPVRCCSAPEFSSHHPSFEQASTTLALVLSESGLSNEDSLLISSKAPSSVQSLIDAARELDELASWSSDMPPLDPGFQQKIHDIAKTSRGRQIGALVESVGVEQRHISRICFILASEPLPDLLEKIRYLEELLPDDNDDGIAIRIRRMMREISINADEGLQKTLSFFEKMEARRGGLNALNIPRKALARLIEEFPQVLVRNLDSAIRPVIAYLEEKGVPKTHMGSVIMCYPSTLLYGSKEQLERRLRMLKTVDVKPRDFGKIIVKYPWILSGSIEHNVEDIVSFLLTIKVPKGRVGCSIRKCPNLLGSSSRTLQLMVQHMNMLGVNSKRLGYALAHSPQLLLKTPRAFNEVLDFLQGFGLEANDMGKLLIRSPELFASTVPLLEKKITFLQDLGIPNHRLKFVVLKYPEVLMMSVEGALKPRFEFLLSTGLSKADISFMVCGFPPLLGYSIDRVLRPKIDFLESVICQSVKEVVMYPRYFSYCLEKKIKPRFRVLKRANVTFDLKSMLSKTDDEFAADYLGFGRMLVPPI